MMRDEGTGLSYGFGYWARDWTNLDPNFGTKEDLAALVQKKRTRNQNYSGWRNQSYRTCY
jgi:hypothetical protein